MYFLCLASLMLNRWKGKMTQHTTCHHNHFHYSVNPQNIILSSVSSPKYCLNFKSFVFFLRNVRFLKYIHLYSLLWIAALHVFGMISQILNSLIEPYSFLHGRELANSVLYYNYETTGLIQVLHLCHESNCWWHCEGEERNQLITHTVLLPTVCKLLICSPKIARHPNLSLCSFSLPPSEC